MYHLYIFTICNFKEFLRKPIRRQAMCITLLLYVRGWTRNLWNQSNQDVILAIKAKVNIANVTWRLFWLLRGCRFFEGGSPGAALIFVIKFKYQCIIIKQTSPFLLSVFKLFFFFLVCFFLISWGESRVFVSKEITFVHLKFLLNLLKCSWLS